MDAYAVIGIAVGNRSVTTNTRAIDKFDPSHPRKERVSFLLFML
jgi:hypothetical protein